MLYLGEVEDEWYTGDEDEVEEAYSGKKMSHFSKVGTPQEHLEQHLHDEATTVRFSPYNSHYTVI